MADHLKNLPLDELAGWYRRLGDTWTKGRPDLGQPQTLADPLAGKFLHTWLSNRQLDRVYEFDAPEHLRSLGAVIDVQRYHRDVFLTIQMAKYTNRTQKWAGVLPRIQGLLGFQKWDMKGDMALSYESLCDPAPNLAQLGRVQLFGTPAERDITGSLRGFQLKSECILSALPNQNPSMVTVQFKQWIASATDRYDWDGGEHFTVFNPDY
jgi:hypothetical protein